MYYLQPISVTLILNLTPIFVLAFSVLFLDEKPSFPQLLGIGLSLCGVFTFFYSSLQVLEEVTGLVVTLFSGIGWAAYMVLSRCLLRDSEENVMVMTSYSMVLGVLMLLATAEASGNIASVSFTGWSIIAWLSIVNTAVAFVLWNHSLKSLKVYEQSILQNTMLVQIALMSTVFLNEQLTMNKILGMTMVFFGVLVVQLKRQTKI